MARQVIYEIERLEGEPLGVELEPPTVRRCANRCEFCFIEGLPKGLRKPLYIRDDDYRLSFAYGNFATLSNLKERDIARILEYRLSPLYVSVHATPWEARKILLNNPRVPDIVEQLTRLADGGIQFHCQMVIVPGLNDGEVLEQSLTDLWNLGDAVHVGRDRSGRAHAVLASLHGQVDGSRERAARFSTRSSAGRARAARSAAMPGSTARTSCICSPSVSCPAPEYYGEFAQIENGVGAVTSLRMRVADGLDRLAAARRPAHRSRHRSGDGAAHAGRCSSDSSRQPAPSSS